MNKNNRYCDFCGTDTNIGFIGTKGIKIVNVYKKNYETHPFICKQCIIDFASTYGVRIKSKDGKCIPFSKA